MLRHSDRVHDYVMNSSPVLQYGLGTCTVPPSGLQCKTTFEQSGVIDIETMLRNGKQSYGVVPQSNVETSNISTMHVSDSESIAEWNLRECKSTKTISKLENDRWHEPTPNGVYAPRLLDVNSVLGIDTRQLIKYESNI